MKNQLLYADDSTESVGLLVKLRLPWLMIGLLGGIFASTIVAKFETILVQNISLAFFLPLIVYMSDAVGTQTETIFIRHLSKKQENFGTYLLKEILLGLCLGLIFGILVAIVANLWLDSVQVALTVGLAMFATVATAPLIALIVPAILYREHTDPALGAGPFATVIQDIASILIYFLIATVILI